MLLTNLLWIQFVVLLAGTIFAWYQWAKVFKQNQICQSCAADSHPNPDCHTCFNSEEPFKSKCFFGAIFFTIAFLLNLCLIYCVQLMMTVGV